MEKHLVSISKYMSFILRHKPETIGLKLDENGWASATDLIENTTKFKLDLNTIKLVVETNDKQRFSLDNEKGLIRANQGHSVDINLGLEPRTPPPKLLHGTAERFLGSINKTGLTKQKRHHVHLSESSEVAIAVGSRYGKPVLLEVDTKLMFEEGYQFFRSVNNVWLVEDVPPKFIVEKHD